MMVVFPVFVGSHLHLILIRDPCGDVSRPLSGWTLWSVWSQTGELATV